MGIRGAKAADRSGWIKPGGSLPKKAPADLKPAEAEHFRWIVSALEKVGVGGNSDLMAVVLAARIAARCDMLRALVDALPEPTVKTGTGALAMHPAFAELSRSESRLRDCLSGLYLYPRTRGTSRLPAETIASAASGAEKDELPALLRVRRG